jgi:hypothetical protein
MKRKRGDPVKKNPHVETLSTSNFLAVLGCKREAPRAKARAITRKLAQPGVKDAIHPCPVE